mmetsp:Transcript_19426/g.44255  ORF Transcript_19426/g.44255 Transcript_19426/m.44255 type:complete len:104 (-) Transcript_19426:311-622(-)
MIENSVLNNRKNDVGELSRLTTRNLHPVNNCYQLHITLHLASPSVTISTFAYRHCSSFPLPKSTTLSFFYAFFAVSIDRIVLDRSTVIVSSFLERRLLRLGMS